MYSSVFIFISSFHTPIKSIPLTLVNKNIFMNHDKINTNWETLGSEKYRIVERYFKKRIDNNDNCDIFCIEGIPSACIIYKNIDTDNNPIIQSIYINKGIFIIFDVGKEMRDTFFSRYKGIQIGDIESKGFFLSI